MALSLSSLCVACPQPTATGPADRDSAPQVMAQTTSSAPKTSEAPPLRRDGTILADTTMMGTRVSINLWLDPGKTPLEAGQAIEAAFAEMARIEDIASEWKQESPLSQLNRGAGGPAMEIPPELVEILARSVAVSEATDGLFDVTFHGVGALWSFTPNSRPPSPAKIKAALANIDYRAIEFDADTGRARLARPGMAIGLGAVAKGFAVDAGTTILKDAGFHNHIVEAGGDTFISGSKGARPWRIGVQDPRASAPGRLSPGAAPTRPVTVGWLQLTDQAVVTSGNYERYFEYQGRHYTHILDPRTGWPIPREVSPQSVTLVADTATDADAYCTAVTVMGAEAGLKFVESRPDLETIIISATGEVLVSSGLLDEFMTNTQQEPPRP